jgi:hypothetical protein
MTKEQQYKKEYRERNKEKLREYHKRYRLLDVEGYREAKRIYMIGYRKRKKDLQSQKENV